MKRVYIDTETTGLYYNVHGIHQIAGIIEIDGEIVDQFNYNVQPADRCEINDDALAIAHVTREDLKTYPPMQDVYAEFTELLGKYVNKYDRKDKFFFYAYNSAFDWRFMLEWFKDNGDKYFCSWFYANHIDIMTLAGVFFQDVRSSMGNFKLMTVAQTLKALKLIDLDLEGLDWHNALTDIIVSKVVCDAVTDIENLKLIR
jgi:DNA polymerase-3 subunit epsilon